jgi:alpha-methylacyl-CoA racemase
MSFDCLAGIRVLDLSQYIPGPFATRMLADLGAEVIKVEPPAGDPMRTLGPLGEDGLSPDYHQLNSGKTVVRIDLKTPGGKEQLARLLAKAHVLMDSFRPGTLDKLGFNREKLEAINPGLVHCALSGFGQTGPHRLVAGHDMTYLALTGGLVASGVTERPTPAYPPLADHAGALQAAVSILAALLRRTATGKGAHLDVSLCESAMAWQYQVLANPQSPPGRESIMLNGGAAYYRNYRTRDGRFAAFVPIEDKFWQAFCKAVDRPDLVARHDEPMPQTDLIAELERLFAARDLAEWQAILGPADCCFEAVLEPAEAISHPHHRARGLMAPAKGDAKGGGVEVLLPLILDARPPSPRPPFRETPAQEILDRWQ